MFFWIKCKWQERKYQKLLKENNIKFLCYWCGTDKLYISEHVSGKHTCKECFDKNK